MSDEQPNIITILNIKIHRLIGKWHSSIMTFGLNKGYVITAVLALVTGIKLLLDFLSYGISVFSDAFVNLLSIGLTGVVAIVTIVSTIHKYRKLSSNYRIIVDESYKNDVINRIKISERHKKNGYELKDFFNGEEYEKYFISDKMNERIIDNKFLSYKDLGTKFEIVDELKNYVPSILKQLFSKNSIVFNGRLVRMVTDLHLDTEIVIVQNTRYFDVQCTNELAYKIIKPSYSMDKLFYGEKLLFNTDQMLYDLEFSSCANIIGASTIVITKDRKIIIGRQGGLSNTNSGRYAPSGSGSVEMRKDLKKEKDFLSGIKRAMEREFSEECNYPKTKKCSKMKTIIIGYARLIERGGTPDFFGISYLNVNSSELSLKIKRSEHGLSAGIKFVDIPIGSTTGESLYEFCVLNSKQKNVSIQLWIIAEILRKFEVSDNIQSIFK